MLRLERFLILITTMSFGAGLYKLSDQLPFIMESWGRISVYAFTLSVCALLVWSLLSPSPKVLRVAAIYWLAQSFGLTVGKITYAFSMGATVYLSFRFGDEVVAAINLLGPIMAYLFFRAARLRERFEGRATPSNKQHQ